MDAIIVALRTLILLLATFIVFILFNGNYPQKPYTYADFNFDYEVHTITKAEAIELCTSLVGNYKIVFKIFITAFGL